MSDDKTTSVRQTHGRQEVSNATPHPGLTRRMVGVGIVGAATGAGIGCTAGASSFNDLYTSGFPEIDPLALVDRELLDAAKAMPQATVSAATLRQMRARRRSAPMAPPAPQLTRKLIPGPRNAPDVVIMIVDPIDGSENKPAFLHIHGGGFVSGAADSAPAYLQQIAQTCSCVVVSVDYRLAPETPFPGALEDNYAALRWLSTNAVRLGIDRNRIAIGGESAGGGHAAMLAIAARDRGEFPIAFQLLNYPMLDDRTGSVRQVAAHLGRVGWNAASNRFGWAALLGQEAGRSVVPKGSVPARVPDLGRLPATFIGVGALDLFVDENMDYARRLILAGVPTELLVVPGAFHGFEGRAPAASVSIRFQTAKLDALRRGLS